MIFLPIILGIVLLVLLVTLVKLDTFISFMIVCLFVGLATGAGSITFSHINDGGFWLFKEYFNLSIKETLQSWTLMETTVLVVGLLGVLLLNLLI